MQALLSLIVQKKIHIASDFDIDVVCILLRKEFTCLTLRPLALHTCDMSDQSNYLPILHIRDYVHSNKSLARLRENLAQC